MAKTQVKKALHLQKQKNKTALASDEAALGDTLSSDAWYSSNEAEIGQFTDLGKQFEMIKSQLILYHDDNELSLKTLVDFWNDSSSLTTLVAPTIPFGYAQKMYAIACTAVELGDFHAAKCNILAAGTIWKFCRRIKNRRYICVVQILF